jgi:hypothetical protein
MLFSIFTYKPSNMYETVKVSLRDRKCACCRGRKSILRGQRALVKILRVLVEALGMPILAGECIVEAMRVSIEFVRVPIDVLEAVTVCTVQVV